MALEYLTYQAELGAEALHPGGRAATRALLERLALADGQRVLEIGCGTGATLVRILLTAAVTADAFDITPAMLRAAGRRQRLAGLAGRCRLALADAASLPVADAAYDRVVAESVLGFQSTERTRAILAEIARVLRPGGRLVANEAVWRAGVDATTVRAVNEHAERSFGLRPASELPWGVDDWRRLITAAGLAVCEVEPVGQAMLAAGRRGAMLRPRLLAARLVTLVALLRGALRRETLARRRAYRRLIAASNGGAALLEAHLFVAERPRAREAGRPS